MSKPLKTAGELRDFLLTMMQDVREGRADLQRASTLAKLAAQVTASLSVEAQMALVAQKTGREFGAAHLGSAEEAQSEKPAQISSRLSGEPIWCEQCEERVHPAKAEACKSPFCKARAQGEADGRGA